jgi:hypothetical protein
MFPKKNKNSAVLDVYAKYPVKEADESAVSGEENAPRVLRGGSTRPTTRVRRNDLLSFQTPGAILSVFASRRSLNKLILALFNAAQNSECFI